MFESSKVIETYNESEIEFSREQLRSIVIGYLEHYNEKKAKHRQNQENPQSFAR